MKVVTKLNFFLLQLKDILVVLKQFLFSPPVRQ